MPTSQTPKTQDLHTDQPIPEEDFLYAERRYQNLLYRAIVNAFTQEAKAGRITRALLAKRINKEPPQITRWLSSPSNMTAKTTSRILLGMNAELKEPEVEFYRDTAKPNYAHSLIELIERTKTENQPEPQRIEPQQDSSVSAASTTSANEHVVIFYDPFNHHTPKLSTR